MEVNGEKINKDRPLGDVISQYGVGDTVAITILRGPKTLTLQATLAKRPGA